MTAQRPITEEQMIVLGFRPRTVKGWWFWLRYWSLPAIWLTRCSIALGYWWRTVRGQSKGGK